MLNAMADPGIDRRGRDADFCKNLYTPLREPWHPKGAESEIKAFEACMEAAFSLSKYFISTVKRLGTISTVFHIHTQSIFQYDCINDFSSNYIITGIVKYRFLFSYVVRTHFFFTNLKCPKSPRKWGDLGHM